MEFKNHNLEYDTDDNDDAFYVELRRQILLLTEDNEDEDFHRVTESKRGSSRVTSFPSCVFHNGNYFHWWEGENNDSPPDWLVNLWKSNCNGTGVFIPQLLKSRRRYRHSGKSSNEKSKLYRARKQL